jgi:hypothetical protein
MRDRRCDLLLASFHQEILQIQQRLFWRVHVNKRCCNACLAASSSPANLMNVVLDFFGHRKNDDVLDFTEVEAFRRDARSHHDILRPGLE